MVKLSKKTLKAIGIAERKAKREGLSACHLFSVSNDWITYTGVIWEHNCFYTVSDMTRNGDFAVGYGRFLGCDFDIPQDLIDELQQELLNTNEYALAW